MTGEIITKLREIFEDLHSDYRFEYDEASVMNTKADGVNTLQGLIYIEEIRRGRYRIPQTKAQGYFVQKETSIDISFCRFGQQLGAFASIGDTPASIAAQRTLTDTRQAIRDKIEQEVVMPFMQRLYSGGIRGWTFGDFTFTYPRSRFDANEISVGLSFTILQQSICLSSLM